MVYYGGFKPYVRKADRVKAAQKRAEKMSRSGMKMQPVQISGRELTRTFWGKAWCRNLEAYSDFSNRLPRGRTYVRNGSVFHLEVSPGRVRALVSGSSVYEVSVEVKAIAPKHWTVLKRQCGAAVTSLLELLQGKISENVMEIITTAENGLFPNTREITFSCSCPDGAYMCKHVAAVLYGIGSRFDADPALFFALRGVDPAELVASAAEQTLVNVGDDETSSDDLSRLFGIDIEPETNSRGRSKKASATEVPEKQPPVKKPPEKQTPEKQPPVKKAPEKKAPVKKAPEKKPPEKKPPEKKPPVKKAPAKKAPAKKAPAKKTPVKKTR